MPIEEELEHLSLLYQIIKDKSVQRRFATTCTCDMKTGKLNQTRAIDRCEKYVTDKIKELAGKLGDKN